MELLGLHLYVNVERKRPLEVNAFKGFRSGIANSNSKWMQQGEDCGIFLFNKRKSEWLKMRKRREMLRRVTEESGSD